VLIEAMASKKPCIGSNLDGIPEVIVNGVTGYLFTPGNSEDLADKMEILINNKRLRIQMGNEGFKRVNDHFNTDLFLKRTKNFYDKVIQKAG
jgi:glycosyltransferase involved in cell wall biosynthesis